MKEVLLSYVKEEDLEEKYGGKRKNIEHGFFPPAL